MTSRSSAVSTGRKTFSVSFIALLLVSAFSFTLLAAPAPVKAQSSGTLNLGFVQSPATIGAINQFGPGADYYFYSEMYLPWYAYYCCGQPVLQPILGNGYSSNANYTHWVFNLKEGLKWDDGTPLNATDLYYSFSTDIAEGWLPYSVTNGSITVVNSTAISFDTPVSEPNAPYYWCVDALGIILPYEVYGQIPLANLTSFTALQGNIVTDGPFVFHSYTVGENPVPLTANPYYYAGAPHIQTVYIHMYSSLSSYITAFKSGALDAFWGVGAYEAFGPSIANTAGYSLYNLVPGGLEAVTFNMNEYPYNTTQFRLALAYATNATEINQRMNAQYASQYVVDSDVLLPQENSQVGLSPSQIPNYDNLSMVKTELNSIGFTQNSAGKWLYPNGTAVTITVETADFGYGDVSVATLVVGMWQAAGFDVNLQTLTTSSYVTLVESSNTGWQVGAAVVTPGYGLDPSFEMLSMTKDDPSQTLSLSPVNGVPNWNLTKMNAILSQAEQYPLGSAQSNGYVQQAALEYYQTVPIIPLFDIGNYQSLSNSYFWGSQSAHTGVFSDNDGLMLQLYWGTLDLVQPLSATTSSTTTAPTSVASTTPSTTTTGPTTSTSTSPSSSFSGNDWLITGVVIVVIILIAAGVYALRRRGPGPPKPPGTS
jgi:peptide/nickel transport system substrate-binding protein